MLPYDYGSVMHYEANAFSANGQLTIVPTQNATAVIGQRVGMSEIDVLEVQRYYGCLPTPTATAITSTTTTVTSTSTQASTTTTTAATQASTTTPITSISTTSTQSIGINMFPGSALAILLCGAVFWKNFFLCLVSLGKNY